MNLNVLILLTLSVVQANLFGAKTGIRELNPTSFKKEVLYNGNVSVVAFYAPWCGYCQKLAPELKSAAKSLKGIARVSAVNCENSQNQAMCQRYGVKGYPTIKVFQPAKLTDIDFKDVLEGKSIPRRKPKMFSYNGERTGKAMASYAIKQLRNYAATLSNDDALRWLAPNLVPRVIMLPGKKYKSKSVSPLFKVLSREYFGKMRFSVIPRRVDGAWNLLGIEAPDESQLVYMSDDKEPVMYKGSMKKKQIRAFLDEQYALEMTRRKQKGGDQAPKRDDAANGLEYVEEDAQTEELEHVVKRRNKALKELEELKEAKRQAYERAGIAYSEEEETTFTQIETTKSSSPNKPTDGIEESIIEFDDDANDSIDSEESIEEDDFEEAALDETIIDISPEQLVQEGPEAVAKHLEMVRSMNGELEATTVSPNRPEITSVKKAEAGITNYDHFVERCLRTGFYCAVAIVNNGTFESDLSTFIKSLNLMPKQLKQKTVFEYIVAGNSTEVDGFLQSVDVNKRPSLFFWDPRRQKAATLSENWTDQGIADFATKAFNRKLDLDIKIPSKYLYWITAAEVKAQEEAKEKKGEEFYKEEL